MRLRLLLVLGAVAAYVVPVPARVVERYYSEGIFPVVQVWLTSFSNVVPFALFDALIAVVGVALVTLMVRDLRLRGAWPRRVLRALQRLVVTCVVVYLGFLLAWGFNYRRVALREKLAFAEARVTPDRASALAREGVSQLNGLYAAAHAAGWPGLPETDTALAAAFRRAARDVGSHDGTVPGRPKQTLLDLYFRRAGVAGMTDPFFLETLVTSTLLPFERPSVVAHEWAHLAGFTDEGEANFVGWLACLRGAAPHQYSGWLFLFSEVVGALPRDQVRDISSELDAGPRADLQAIRDRLLRDVNPRVSAAGWQVYDQYLKANRVSAGTASYAEVVRLVLGTDMR